MKKISVTGAKKDLDKVIDKLYSLSLLDIDKYNGELDTGVPSEKAEEVSKLLVDVRSTLSKLPEVDDNAKLKDLSIAEVEQNLDSIDEEIEESQSRISDLEKEKKDLRQKRKFFKRLNGTGLSYNDLKGSETLSVFVGKLEREEFEKRTPNENYEIFEGESCKVVLYHKKYSEEFESVLSKVSDKNYQVPETELSGSIEDILRNLKDRRKEIDNEIEEKSSKLDRIANEWRRGLEDIESFLTDKIEKAEAPLKFATTENTFIVYGWIPEKRYHEVKEELEKVTEGKIHVQEEEGENPPVKHENNRFVEPFEDLTDLVSVPKYNELDPSFMLLLTFPLFFGFMIGDFGYGVTSFIVFYLGYRMIEGAEDIFKSLMYASVATMIFGLIYGDAFGFIIFGENSALTSLTGLSVFSKIPVLYHRSHHLSQIFNLSALIGVIHINIGYLLGFYTEYSIHGFKEAFLEKGSWILLEVGAALWYFVGASAGAPVLALSVVLLYLGEGIEGVVEIPSLLSNILSYLRIFGVSVAAISLATVVNALANPLLSMGTAWGLVLGVLLLMVGHIFNTFIKIMEGFLQGIRLHYVEMFQKFYEGGGKKYSPFGS